MTRLVDLLQVVGLRPVGLPNLTEQRLAEIKELVLLEVDCNVRVLRLKIVISYPICNAVRHRVLYHFTLRTVAHNRLGSTQSPNETLVQHVIRRVGVVVLGRVAHDLSYVLARIVQDEVVSTRVVCEEVRHVVDFAIAGDPAAFCSAVGCDVLGGEDADALGHVGMGQGARRGPGYGGGLYDKICLQHFPVPHAPDHGRAALEPSRARRERLPSARSGKWAHILRHSYSILSKLLRFSGARELEQRRTKVAVQRRVNWVRGRARGVATIRASLLPPRVLKLYSPKLSNDYSFGPLQAAYEGTSARAAA